LYRYPAKDRPLNVQNTPDPATKTSGTPDLAAILANSGNQRKKRRWVWPTVLIVVVAAAAGAYSYFGSSGPRYDYTTQPAKRGGLSVIVTATGSVQPTDQVDISSEQIPSARSMSATTAR
jgi:HlyD family secretion protein